MPPARLRVSLAEQRPVNELPHGLGGGATGSSRPRAVSLPTATALRMLHHAPVTSLPVGTSPVPVDHTRPLPAQVPLPVIMALMAVAVGVLAACGGVAAALATQRWA